MTETLSHFIVFLVFMSIFLKTACSIKSLVVYALVICNHAPHLGNSGDFDFWSSKASSCRDCSLVKPLLISPQPDILSFHGPFCIIPSKSRIFPSHCRGKTLVKASLISMAIPHPIPGLGSVGAWLQMTSALT